MKGVQRAVLIKKKRRKNAADSWYIQKMYYLCNRKRKEMVPWMSGLVSGLQNRVRRFESARNLNYRSKALESQVLSRACFLWRPFRGPLENSRIFSNISFDYF